MNMIKYAVALLIYFFVISFSLSLFFGLDGLNIPIAIGVCILLYWFAPRSWFFINDERSGGHMRGSKIVKNADLVKLAAKESNANALQIANVPIPFELENRHFMLAGSTGSGKSQAFYQIADQARRRGDAAIAPDVNGEFTARFYRADEDVILSPFDQRSPMWSPLAEMGGVWDADRIAKSIIPDGHDGSSAEWTHYAQVILSVVLLKIWRASGTNGDLLHYLLFSDQQSLSALCEGSEASRMFAEGNERMLSSVLSIVATYAKPLSHLPKNVGKNGFSITQFVQKNAESSDGKWLFFPVRDDMFKMLRPLISAQIDIAISALLSAQDDESRRVWFFVDEFATWGRIEGIEPLLTKSRKKGGCAVLGLQSVSQVKEKYGNEKSKTLLSNLGNWLTLRAGDGETAEYMSQNIGDEEIRRWVSSESSNSQGDSYSNSEQIVKQRVVFASELQTLKDLKGILNIAGPLPSGWVDIPISKLTKTVNPFELKAEPEVEDAGDDSQQTQSEDFEDFIP